MWLKTWPGVSVIGVTFYSYSYMRHSYSYSHILQTTYFLDCSVIRGIVLVPRTFANFVSRIFADFFGFLFLNVFNFLNDIRNVFPILTLKALTPKICLAILWDWPLKV